jgi:hypothetical protein
MQVVKMCHETAFDKLYRWTQTQVSAMRVDSPEISRELREAIKALKTRPILFQSIADDIASLRKSAMMSGFLEALTRGGPDGFSRPIEFHAHDPLRYIGDMLAWIHQACASERDMLLALFYGNFLT